MAQATIDSKSNNTPEGPRTCSVYAIELKKTVWLQEAGFRKKNPHLPKEYNGSCYYIGQSRHLPECRYKQHVSKRRNTPGAQFMCGCFTEQPIKRAYRPSNSPGRYVSKYHMSGGLRSALFEALNPVADTQEAAELAEKRLAQ